MSNLNFGELRKANASRAPRWHTSDAGMMEWTVGDWFMAMAGEVGEGADELLPLMFMAFVGKVGQLGNMAKKYRRVQEGIANKSDDPERHIHAGNALVKMFDEIADVQIYLDLFALRLRETMNYHEDIGDHVEQVFNRTSEKYGFPERLIDGQFMLSEPGGFLVGTKTVPGEIFRSPDGKTMRFKLGDAILAETSNKDVHFQPIFRGMAYTPNPQDTITVQRGTVDTYAELSRPVMEMEPGERSIGKSPALAAPYVDGIFTIIAEDGAELVEETVLEDLTFKRLDWSTPDHSLFGSYTYPEPVTFKAGTKHKFGIRDRAPVLFVCSSWNNDNRRELQHAEFDAVQKLADRYKAITLTAPVDDDYPLIRGRYESAMMDFLRAIKANGRTLPPWK